MNPMRNVLVVAALLVVVVTAQVQAQEVRTLDISFNDGRVTLVAENVTLREILAEWARKGGSRIVNADRLTGQPVLRTQFENQPEAEVIRALLRELPGYGASMRPVAEANMSAVEAVFILATRLVAPSQTFSTATSAASTMTPVMGSGTLEPDAASRFVQAPPGEIPPPPPVTFNGEPTAQELAAKARANSHLRAGPGGVVTSTVPGVILSAPTPAAPAVPPAPGGPAAAGIVLPGQAGPPEPRGPFPLSQVGRGRGRGGGR